MFRDSIGKWHSFGGFFLNYKWIHWADQWTWRGTHVLSPKRPKHGNTVGETRAVGIARRGTGGAWPTAWAVGTQACSGRVCVLCLRACVYIPHCPSVCLFRSELCARSVLLLQIEVFVVTVWSLFLCLHPVENLRGDVTTKALQMFSTFPHWYCVWCQLSICIYYARSEQ